MLKIDCHEKNVKVELCTTAVFKFFQIVNKTSRLSEYFLPKLSTFRIFHYYCGLKRQHFNLMHRKIHFFKR